MITILEKETKEIFKMLEEAGMNPQWCDTPVPYFDASVQAGLPTDPGDIPFEEQLMMAQNLATGSLTFCVNVKGDSMMDADIHDGDRVELLTGVSVKDGDIVIAEIDREYTLKTFFGDEWGNKWLVPANKAFKPILLTEEMDVRILGKVVRVFKDAPRMSYAELHRIVKSAKSGMADTGVRMPTPERIEQIIREMGDVVKQGRQWYAVYRAMVDKGVLENGDYGFFCDKVIQVLPEHGHLPVASELRRLAVQSFRKPVALWKSNDAPVSNYRYEAYLRIANLTAEKLRK